MALLIKEFNRQGGDQAVDRHTLFVPVPARYIRFHPTKQYSWNCMRAEVYASEFVFIFISLLSFALICFENGSKSKETKALEITILDIIGDQAST